jgi:hypothetical protein
MLAEYVGEFGSDVAVCIMSMSFSGKVRPPAVDTDDAMEATDVPEVRRGIAPDVRRTGATLGDGGIGDDIC